MTTPCYASFPIFQSGNLDVLYHNLLKVLILVIFKLFSCIINKLNQCTYNNNSCYYP